MRRAGPSPLRPTAVRAVLATLALVVAVGGWVAAQGGDADPAPEVASVPATILEQALSRPADAPRPTWPAAVRRQDPDERDPRRRRALTRELAGWRAYQALPFSGDGILIEVIEAAPDGRVVLRVLHRGSRAAARAAYRRFLRLHRDSGRHYLPAYRALAERPQRSRRARRS